VGGVLTTPRAALRLVLRHCAPLAARRVALDDALGLVMAEDVRTPIPLPPFDNSAMDGYALRARDSARATARRPARLRIAGTIHAGERAPRALRVGEAMAIMTGAALPRGADAVLRVEAARVERGELVVRAPVARGAYVRARGEEVGRGAKVVARGDVIHPGVVCCLAAIGRSHARVVRRPVVSVITTGDETVAPGRPLGPGRVYDSNSAMLGALLAQAGIAPARVRRVADRPAALQRALDSALAASDVVITVGGVSVGAHDYARAAFARAGVRQVFWRVRQQPGKPLFFGRKGRRLVFGLPGNPASAFTCFYLYVLPALRALGGRRAPAPTPRPRALANDVVADPRRWRLLKASASGRAGSRVAVLPRQGSHMVTSLAQASHLVIAPPSGGRTRRGGKLPTVRLPHAEEAED